MRLEAVFTATSILCPLICGIMGYLVTTRPPNPRRQIWFEVAFVGIAVIGAGSAVWLAYLNSTSQLTRGDVRREVAAATYMPPKIIVPITIPIGPTKADAMRINAVFLNQGNSAVANATPHFALGWADGTISTQKLDEIFSGLRAMPQAAGLPSDRLEPGESRTTTLPGELNAHTALTVEKIREIKRKSWVVLFALELTYLDVRDGSRWETQVCQYWDYRVPKEYKERILPHKCQGHNGVFRMT
ncbi:MAG TPA: hypothetical protein VG960_03870 [Caulobacteraceae bacterium]|nr:hypothetical protein [Caulobacteraceae bacterium]